MFWFCLLQVWTLWFVEHTFSLSMLSQVCGVFMHCPGSVQGVKPPYVCCFYRSLFPLRTRCCIHVVNCSVSLSFFGLFRSFALQSSFSFHQRVFASTCSRRQACALQMLPCVGSSFALPYPAGFCTWGLTRSFDSSALLGLPFSKARPYLFDFATNFNTDRSSLFGLLFRSIRDLFGFDHTCGYPGEGPPWSCVSANVNSVNSHPHCLEWVDDLICIQEARLSSTNIQNPRKKLNSIGRDFFYAKLLQPTRQRNGIKHVPHGGTACIAAKDLCRNFTSQDDATSLWQELADTSRISAVWVQILPKLRLLAFTFYGQATMNGISSHDINNLYLEKIFTIASQFGDVPIIICGDFQDDPDTFLSVQHAKNFDDWTDPISKQADDGTSCRPITYSRNSDFENPADNFSSIDGILLNRTASAALASVEVLHTEARQHAPIRATFKWERVFQKGFTLVKPAVLDLSKLPAKEGKLDFEQIDDAAQELWNSKYKSLCSQKDDDKAWQSINNFAIHTLCQQGACFKKGPRERAKQPTLKPHVACPGQDFDGSAFTCKSSKLSKVHRLVSELRFRLDRKATNTADFNITFKLQNKVAFELGSIKEFHWWNKDQHLNPHILEYVQKQLQQCIVEQRLKDKRARISAWKEKMISSTKSKQVDKWVFQWINGKSKISTSNLILNKNGDIILSPTEAIAEINDQWDSVFASNIHHSDPEIVLSKVWPFIQKTYSKVELPPVTAEDLKNQIARRKVNAAPGLDGWRTVEVQTFPLTVLAAIASYFNQVESGHRALPQNLTLAKQVILDKGTDDTPLSKRLISLLSVLLLSYTGLRYRQLQEWQNKCLPIQLFGGIKHRKMSSVHSQMQLQIDAAHMNNFDLVGLKLDKSKCFDRLVPKIAACLFIAFGLPVGLTRFFLLMYQGLKRFMCYKQWISTRATTAPNGLVQGCSLSLLAINLHMAAWALMLDKTPEVSLAIFIDDSYMWARATKMQILQRAFEITMEWDLLVGQVLNMKKCQAWGTSTNARNSIRSIFPHMQMCLTLEVLGATVHTSNAHRYEWPEKKTNKILRDIQLIKAIPCARTIQEHLISVKVIPQLTFAAHLNGIPIKALNSFQNAVADGLWRGRPMWRSKGMLLAIISDPDRCDPFAARAYSTIVDTLDFLKHAESLHREHWQQQFESGSIRPNSLIHHYFQAASVLGIEMITPFHLSLWNAPPVSFLDLAKRDLKIIMKIAVRDMCYRKASFTSRKDISPAENVLDIYATRLANKACKSVMHKSLPLQCHRDASIVGSCITNDRRFAAGLSETDQCRYCDTTKETFAHLAHECQQIPLENRPFCNTSKGPNFGNLGIVECPINIVRQRLQISSTSSLQVEMWTNTCNFVIQHVWTDGSCDYTQDFWSTIGGFAVISFHGKVLQKGPVFHWALSAYSCELWAIIVAFVSSDSPIVCHSDCLSLCNQVEQLIQQRKVDPSWAHLEWWNFLLYIFNIRLQWSDNPLAVEWCPAHVLDHLPLEMISTQQARQHNTTWLNIARNREADKQAKQACSSQKPVSDHQRACDHKSITDWQMWITNICALVAESSIDATKKSQPWGFSKKALKNCGGATTTFPDDLTILHPTDDFAKFLPRWDWFLDPACCDWVPTFQSNTPLKSYAKISCVQWETALRFFCGLRWFRSDSKKLAFIELAYHAWYSGWIFPNVEANPAAISSFLKKVVNQAHKIMLLTLCPGKTNPTCKSNGKTFPAGYIENATILLHPRAIKQLAIDAHKKSQVLKSWSGPFPP